MAKHVSVTRVISASSSPKDGEIARVDAVMGDSTLTLPVLFAPVVIIRGTLVSLPVRGWGDSWWLSGRPRDEPEHRLSFTCFSSESCSYLRNSVNSSNLLSRVEQSIQGRLHRLSYSENEVSYLCVIHL